MKKKIIDFDKEFTDIQSSLCDVSSKLRNAKEKSNLVSEEIIKLEKELQELGLSKSNSSFEWLDIKNINHNHYSSEFFSNLSKDLEEQVTKEVNGNTNLLPATTKLDYSVALIIGTLGAVVDMLYVKIPSDITYLNQYEQKGSKITEWLKSLGIDEDGKLNHFFRQLEQTNKVSFDASTKHGLGSYSEEVSGFYPKTHRLMSLGHDPFYGLIFGLLDIINGNITLIDSKGVIHNVSLEKFQDITFEDKVFAPFVWIGHILSDVCTKMGVPVPGWGFTQLLQFGSFGENNRTFADLARYMYLEGYDLRHLVTMGIVPGIIDLCMRIYFKLTLAESDAYSLLYQRNLKEVQDRIRLEKMLFIAHSVATSGNVLKIILYQGNPSALNISEVLAFVKQSVEMVRIQQRNTTGEKVIRNRQKINDEWNNIK